MQFDFSLLRFILSYYLFQVFYMRTVNVTDFIPIRQFNTDNDKEMYKKKKKAANVGIEIILEPLQKWKLPDELVCMRNVLQDY